MGDFVVMNIESVAIEKDTQGSVNTEYCDSNETGDGSVDVEIRSHIFSL